MAIPLRVLIVEDSQDDALLIVNQLKKEYDINWQRVDSKAVMTQALAEDAWDIVISDYVLPGFGGLEALDLARARGRCLPFIMISGTVGEETAVETLKAGADDYLMKDNLLRLIPAIKRALKDAANCTERLKIQQKLFQSERLFSSVFSSIQDGISILDTEMNVIRVNSVMEIWYAHAMPLVGKKCYEVFHKRSQRCDICPSCETLTTSKSSYAIVPLQGPDGSTVGWLDLYSFPLYDTATGKLSGVIEYVRDITERKKAEEQLSRVNQELREKVKELEMLNEVMMGREERIIELKEELRRAKAAHKDTTM